MQQNKQTLSLIVDTLNEEENIDECCKNLHWVDEMIIVDMHSSDQTRKIIKKYTNKIFLFRKSYIVEAVRNFSISKTTQKWILIIDADERMPEGAEKIIRKLIEDKNVDGYWFPRKQYINEKTYLKHGYFYPDLQLRLFRNNGKIKYSGVIHEQPFIPKERTKIINELQVIHNSSHTKYDSIFHFNRFSNYIKIEGKEESRSSISAGRLFVLIPLDFVRHIYRSFIKLEGYKDGYAGFRAAFIFSLYKACVHFEALKIKLENNV